MEPRLPDTIEVASGQGWRLRRLDCHARVGEPAFEESHARYVIAIVTSGTFTYHGKGGRELLHTGSLLLGNCGACYSCSHDQGDGDTCLALQLDESIFEDVAATAAGTMNFRFPAARLPLGRRVLPSVLAIERAIAERDAEPASLEEGVFSFADRVLRELAGLTEKCSPYDKDRRRVSLALSHMDRNSSEKLDLAGLSSIAGMSKYHFLRVFKVVVGTTPHQHLMNLRLREAARLLNETHLPVTEVALACGFGDLSTFNKTFKSCYGMRPTGVRQ